MRRLAKEVIDHLNVATVSNLSDLLEQNTESQMMVFHDQVDHLNCAYSFPIRIVEETRGITFCVYRSG